MIVLRNQTISAFDISKTKSAALLSQYGSKNNVIPSFLCFDANSMSNKANMNRSAKQSRFNVLHKKGDCSLVWNTASDACVLLNDVETKKYESTPALAISSDFFSLLYDLGIYVDEDLDEVFRVDLLRKRHAYSYPENNHIDVEILPTQTCNARCFYCFEQKYTSLTMDNKTVNDVIQYLCSRIKPGQNVCFIWFGGEPLIGEHIIDAILNGVTSHFKDEITFYSSITTNNSLITPRVMDKFAGLWNVRDVLTSLDGYREEHNKRKAYVGQIFDAYSRTLENIQQLIDSSIFTTCRINLDKDNICQLDDILGDLQRFSVYSDFSIQLTTLRNKTDSPSPRSKYFAAEEYSDFYRLAIPKLYRLGFVKDPLSQLPKRESTNCIACALNKVVINANGKLFRCVQDSLDDDNSVGDCTSGIRSNWNYTKWYSEIDNLGNACENCVFLPNCQGGCKQYRRAPSFDTTPCFRKKFYIDIVLDEIISSYYGELKKCRT